MESAIAELKRQMSEMRRGYSAGRLAPHKPLLLLAILDMFDAGEVSDNKIYYDSELVERFKLYFEVVKREGQSCRPSQPFFHLRSSPFWTLVVIQGRESAYASLTTSGGGWKTIVENIAYASFAPWAFGVLSSPAARQSIRDFLITQFFDPEDQSALRKVADSESRIGRYQQSLGAEQVMEEEPAYVREPAFRRVVTKAYDYRCALCGLRIVLPDVPSPVDAAHLIPWGISHDDRPDNGIALCRLHHWALDVGLVSPDHHYLWKVSDVLDSRRDSERELSRFDGTKVLLPQAEAFLPRHEAIDWRLQRLICSKSIAREE